MAQGLGLYVSDDTVRWAIAEWKAGAPHLASTGRFKLDDEPNLPDQLPNDVGVCFGSADSYFYPLSFPFSSRRKVLAVLKSDIEGRSLDPPDTIVADYYVINEEKDATTGLGITMPRDRVALGVAVGGEECEPALVTLDVFALTHLIRRTKLRSGRYFLAAFTERTSFIAEVEDGTIRKVRSIPGRVDSAERARDAIAELTKRFDVEDPAQDVVVHCGIEELDASLRKHDDLPFHMIDVSMQGAPSDASDVVPVAAALAAVSPSAFPNFRREDLTYPGVFHALVGHSIVFISIVAVFLLVLIVLLAAVRGGYEQQVTSIDARLEEKAALVIGREELDKELARKDVKNDLTKAIKNISAKYRSPAPNEGEQLPASSFKSLKELLALLPEDLDVSWDRIIVTQMTVSLTGKFTPEHAERYYQFVSNIKDSGSFQVRFNSVTAKNSFRLTLQFKKD